jgi:hypothetical protein
VVTAFSKVVVRNEYLHIFTTLSLVFTALEVISYLSLEPSWIFGYTNQKYISANQRGKYQCATHLPRIISEVATLYLQHKNKT